ncbi:unnamed protein product [Lupinus luteus]|uniref:Uncharacterized protein n=1 Tax=Lupinus luteus TaxID=3873 RepID=A0AAV1Y4A3_LUPLU
MGHVFDQSLIGTHQLLALALCRIEIESTFFHLLKCLDICAATDIFLVEEEAHEEVEEKAQKDETEIQVGLQQSDHHGLSVRGLVLGVGFSS